jgi:hypothetical protein
MFRHFKNHPQADYISMKQHVYYNVISTEPNVVLHKIKGVLY